jgi:chromosome segregation ATPase
MTPMTRRGIRVRLVRNLEDYLARSAADLDQRGEVLEERRAALARLEAQLIEQEGVLAERRRRIEELSLPEETNRLVDELFKRLDDWEAATQGLRTEVASLQQQVATARETIRAGDERLAVLESERANLLERIEEAEPAIDAAHSARTEAEARSAELEHQLESEQRHRAGMEGRLAELDELCRQLQRDRADQDSRLAELEARSRELERLLDQERNRREEADTAADVEHLVVEIDEPRTRAATTEESASSHLLFRQRADGYELVAHEGPPPPVGSEIRSADADQSFIVLNVGTSPFPGDPRPCAFLQLLTRA